MVVEVDEVVEVEVVDDEAEQSYQVAIKQLHELLLLEQYLHEE